MLVVKLVVLSVPPAVAQASVQLARRGHGDDVELAVVVEVGQGDITRVRSGRCRRGPKAIARTVKDADGAVLGDDEVQRAVAIKGRRVPFHRPGKSIRGLEVSVVEWGSAADAVVPASQNEDGDASETQSLEGAETSSVLGSRAFGALSIGFETGERFKRARRRLRVKTGGAGCQSS